MNSFGFIREACHALGTSFSDNTIFDDLVEYDPTKMDKSSQSIDELNAIAGGDYWQDIINQYKARTIDGYEAEARFSEQYCQRLRQSYKYVLNMPLRISFGIVPIHHFTRLLQGSSWNTDRSVRQVRLRKI